MCLQYPWFEKYKKWPVELLLYQCPHKNPHFFQFNNSLQNAKTRKRQLENTSLMPAIEDLLSFQQGLQICLAPSAKDNPFLWPSPHLAWLHSCHSTWIDTHFWSNGVCKDRTIIKGTYILSASLTCSSQESNQAEIKMPITWPSQIISQISQKQS